MLNRRDFLQVTAAAATLMGTGAGGLARAAAAGAITQDGLLRFPALGNVTLLHVTDIHGQLNPLYFREPAVNLGVGEAAGLPPHLTGRDFLEKFEIKAGSPEAYALTSEDYVQLARQYGKVGGLDRLATLVKAIQAERGDKVLLLDGGDSLQGSWGALQTRGGDMARALKALGVEASTGHWEFTYGADRVPELAGELGCPFLCGNVRDTEWEEDVFEGTASFERGGVKIAVIGQAFPYTPVANPRWMVPEWSFGIREELVRERVEKARAAGAELVVLLSHNGFDVDRKLASRVEGIDVILTAHTHDALPVAVREGKTLLIASGSHGKYLSRLDLDVRGGEVKGFEYRLIPVFADAIAPDPEMASLVRELRQPFEEQYARVLGTADGLLYRRGNFNGTWDDLICDALLAERDAEIALSPGFRWGSSLLPDSPITMEDVWNQTAITYPAAYRNEMSGEQLKAILEDVADNLFNPDPYYQQGGDMVRVGGMGYSIDISKPMGSRISGMTMLKSGQPVDPSRNYVVAGWASVNEGTEGPAIWDLVAGHIQKQKTIQVRENQSVRTQGA
ncbi:thiosulfohydrolase SoxB [Indioceanicola profundi]|uniref:thiosulfohydrolase SoxB n=1 Tax=Indioceanicola profundi TaxID=2220096 RepID=UPI000E6AB807|nr:thiosulfohydrolase SoxB [Indioceanicola profundi]